MDLTGHRLGHYKIIQEVGRGGMAVVYRAYQTSLNREVAIKVLPRHLGFDRVFVERFQREARASAQLSHPNIVVIYDVGHDQGFYYIVMELLKGRTLKQVIEQDGPLPVERATRIAQQVAFALDYAHDRGFVHRDVKPANIFIGKSDHVTLTDFGIAKATAASRQLTSTGALMGTPEYMSPEQAEGAEVDSRSDLYALGIVLYEMLAGRPPFRTDVPLATLYKQVNETPLSIRQAQPHVPQWLAAVVHRALAKRPQDRHQTAGELANALREQLASRPAHKGRSVGSTTPRGTIHSALQQLRAQTARPIGAVRILLIALLSVLLVTVGAAALLLGSSDGSGSIPTQTRDPLPPLRTDTPPVPTQGLPTAASILPSPSLASPLPAVPIGGVYRFQWNYSGTLGRNQAFQVLIWKEGDTEHQGAGDWVTETSQLVNLDFVPILDREGPGEYLWSVVVVDRNTDDPLSPEATPRKFIYLGPAPETTPTFTPSATLPPTQPSPTAVVAIPQPILTSPLASVALQGVVRFEWTYSRVLGQNQAFQVLIWEEGETQHLGAAQSQTETWQLISLDAVPRLASGGAGEYLWSVVVVDRNIDERLSPEASPRSFVYLGPAGQAVPSPTPPPTKMMPTATPSW